MPIDFRGYVWDAAIDAAAKVCEAEYAAHIEWCLRFPNNCQREHGMASAFDLCRLKILDLKTEGK